MTREARILDDLVSKLEDGQLDRQTFLRRALAIGVSASVASGLASSASAASLASTKTLRVRQPADPVSMDPATTPGGERQIYAGIYEPLVGYAPGTLAPLVPVLADKWVPAKNGLRYDFTLRKGVQFHGGYGELTANDVKFSLERIAGLTNPPIKSGYAADFQALKEVKVTGKYSGSILLKNTFPPLLTVSLPVTGVILSEKAVTSLGSGYPLHPIGTGPYQFDSWSPGQQVVTKKNTHYNGSWYRYIKPVQWDEIDFMIIPQVNAAGIAFQNGSIDFTDITPDNVWTFYNNKSDKVTAQHTFRYNFIAMNQTNAALTDINVRRAIRSAIDVPGIIKAAYGGLYNRANAILPPNMPIGYWKAAPVYGRDVTKAKQYLSAAANVPSSLSFFYSVTAIGGSIIAQIVQSNLKDIGISVNISQQDNATFNTNGGAAQAARQLSLINFGQQAPEPEYSFEWFTCDEVNVWNYMSWCDAQFSALAQKAATTPDPAQRSQMYIQMQQIWDKAANAVWLAFPTLYFVGSPKLKPSVTASGFTQPYNFRMTA